MSEQVQERDESAERRRLAQLYGGEGAVEYLDSVPTMPTMELIELVSGEPYQFLKDAAREELGARAAILDQIIFERREDAHTE